MATSVRILQAEPSDTSPAAEARSRSHRLFRYSSTLATAAAACYAIAVPATFEFYGLTQPQLDQIAPWVGLPAQVVALVLVGWLLLDRSLLESAMRRMWWLILAYVGISIIAGFLWNWDRPDAEREELDVTDATYLLAYWVLAGAFAVAFRQAGGRFRTPRVWLDAAALVAVQLVTLWSFGVSPTLPRGFGNSISIAATLAYALTLSGLLTMGALLCLQVAEEPGRRTHMLLVGAAVAAVAWEVEWLASWLVDQHFVGNYYNYGDVLGFGCIIAAAAACRRSPPRQPSKPVLFNDRFLPAFGALLAIALVAGTVATTRRPETWMVVGLVAVCALLLITRERRAQAELGALRRRLAAEAADARLTELVRRSNDAIVVVDRNGTVSFASPSSAAVLGRSADLLQGARACDLFGASHAAGLQSFLDSLSPDTAEPGVLELRLGGTAASVRAYKVTGANERLNPRIDGIVLTIQDITEQLAMERAVLDVAIRERTRISGDIHDGLGQELTGIALMLQVAAGIADADPERQRRQVESIVAQVDRTVTATRNLARGLSPLHAMAGSFADALRRLVNELNAQIPITLRVEAEANGRSLDGFTADHLYRIAQEALTNSLRHSSASRIEMELRISAEKLLLAVADDGVGMPRRRGAERGLGMRLMEYRARLLGGSLRVAHGGGRGVRVEVALPIAPGAITSA